MQFETVIVDLPLRKTFAISKGAAKVKTNVLAVLDGRFLGEGAGSVAYGPSTVEIEADVIEGIGLLKKESAVTLDLLDLINSLPINASSRAALMGSAVNCLSGQSRRAPWELLGLATPLPIRTSFTFALDAPEATIDHIMRSPFAFIKVKMGDSRDESLLSMLGSITGKEIRIDANGGWSVAQAAVMIPRLAALGVRVIEQPTSPDYVADWPALKPRGAEVELLIDEGMNTLGDFERLHQYCDGINIKMAKSGGIVEAVRMARAARAAGKKVMLGCMVESSIGIAQSVYMSSLADYFDLDGPLLLEHDIADGLLYDTDSITTDAEIIGGPKLRPDVIQR